MSNNFLLLFNFPPNRLQVRLLQTSQKPSRSSFFSTENYFAITIVGVKRLKGGQKRLKEKLRKQKVFQNRPTD